MKAQARAAFIEERLPHLVACRCREHEAVFSFDFISKVILLEVNSVCSVDYRLTISGEKVVIIKLDAWMLLLAHIMMVGLRWSKLNLL